MSSDLPRVEELLSAWKGATVFFHPLWGNHGDRLIRLGSAETIAQADLHRTSNPRRADIILVNGSGGYTRLGGLGALQIVRDLGSRFADKPLVVLPSSWDLDEGDIAQALADREAPTYLYARERYSFRLLSGFALPKSVKIGLDHDMAFHLRNSGYLARLRKLGVPNHILVVERGDAEASTALRYGSARAEGVLRGTVRKIVPVPLRRQLGGVTRLLRIGARKVTSPLVKSRLRKMWNESAFVQESLHMVFRDHPQLDCFPVLAADVSSPSLFTFRQFEQSIANAVAVVTTRLHVAILSALLGKPCYVKYGPYHKIQGVYEFSLSGYGHVKALE